MPNPGNGAREALAVYLRRLGEPNPEAAADHLLAWLWREGFRVVPLDTGNGNGNESAPR